MQYYLLIESPNLFSGVAVPINHVFYRDSDTLLLSTQNANATPPNWLGFNTAFAGTTVFIPEG